MVSLESKGLKLIADSVIDTGLELLDVYFALGGKEPDPLFTVTVESLLLTEHSIFRCSQCRQWLSTRRIDPEKEEWCYGCALEWREAQAAQDAIDEENNRVYGEDGKEQEE